MDEWIEHRRRDGELLGWIRPEGDDFMIIDLLGREDPTPRDWSSAEECLEERGIGWLAEPFELVRADTVVPVRITGVGTDAILAKVEDFGDISEAAVTIRLPFPAPQELRPRTADVSYWNG